MLSGTSRRKERSGAKWIVNGATIIIILSLVLPAMPVEAATGASRTTAIFTGNYYTQEYQISGISGLKITASAYSPDGTRFAAAYSNGEVKLWRVGSGTNQLMISNWYPHGSGYWVDDISWSPDGAKLVTISYIIASIKAWHFSPASPEGLLIWYNADVNYNKVAWSPRGEWVAAIFPNIDRVPNFCGGNAQIDLYDASGYDHINPLSTCSNDYYLTALSWRINKKTIGGIDRDVATVGSRGRLLETYYVDATNHLFVHDWYTTVAAPGDSKITNLSISRQTNRIAVLMESSIWGYFSVFDENGNPYTVLATLPTPSTYARAIAYSFFLFSSGDGGAITPLAIGDKNHVDIYLDNGALLTYWTVTGKVQAVSWTPDGSRVLSGDDGSNLPIAYPTINVYKDSSVVTLRASKIKIGNRRWLELDWNAIPGAYKYYIYTATSPSSFNFQTYVTTTSTSYTMAFGSLSSSSYYLVRTQMGSANGPIGAPSNMAYKQAIYLDASTNGGYQSVALPYYLPSKWDTSPSTINNAADLIGDIGLSIEVARYNPSSPPQYWDTYDSSGIGINFNIVPGEAYRVLMTLSTWYQLVGSWSPSVGVPLTYQTPQMQFDALPYNYNFMDNYFGWPSQVNNVAMWKRNVGPRCTQVLDLDSSGNPTSALLDTATFTLGKGYFSKTTVLGWVYQGYPNYNNWVVPITVQPDPMIENVSITANQQVNLTIKIAGEPGNYVDAMLFDNHTAIEYMRITREKGSPEESTNSTLFWNDVNKEHHYKIILSSNHNGNGNTPVWLSLSVGREIVERFTLVGSEPKIIDLSEAMERALETSRSYYFAALGPNSPDTTFWNFGDGTTGQGVYVEHTYTQSGQYSVAVTIKLEDGTVLWSGTMQLNVP